MLAQGIVSSVLFGFLEFEVYDVALYLSKFCSFHCPIFQHYSVELKDNSVELTEEGVSLAELVLETSDLWDENDHWAR